MSDEPPFRRVLVANRGEIAVRICRSLKEMGVEPVAVHSDIDADAAHVQAAASAHSLGGHDVSSSYLQVPQLLDAACITECDAVHPGNGFLSEDPDFVRALEAVGAEFIGPEADTMEIVGSTERVAAAASAAGVPVLSETQADGDTMRRIEIQILGDAHGDVVALGGRVCTVRKHEQRLVVEAPPPAVAADLRQKMNEAAERLAREVGWKSAGTVEFVLDGNGDFYFAGASSCLAVGHPATEMTTGLDLVALQMRVAAGAALPGLLGDRSRAPDGHAIAVQVLAEGQGRLTQVSEPSASVARVDSGVVVGSEISEQFDPALSQICVHASDRESARQKLLQVLSETTYGGVPTDLEDLLRALASDEFVQGCSGGGCLVL